ncbi:hypothetical protein [Catenuloplanes indicus]|uniref:Uncharacterized protein n=1 Tax=Catenuloplanes indicus TaxID=137267 RepID=A0AAE4B158_9ACTN|nr:hypothetical protein [Catenuloplanes indicus]MDQ0371070.1 hypothetical protein [Catenuloplanes indicus]
MAVLIPFIANGDGKGAKPDASSAASNSGQASTIQANSGGCNVQGSGNVVACGPGLEQSYGQISLAYYIDSFYYTGTAQELPAPPDYPAENANDHCKEWQSWIAGNPAMYNTYPYIDLEMLSGSADLVVVKSAEVAIFKRTPSAGGTALTCRHTGGDIPS